METWHKRTPFLQNISQWLHSFLSPKIGDEGGGGGSHFWNLDKEGGHEKIAQK